MTKHKIQGFHSLMNEMRTIAQGKKPAPKEAGGPSFESIEAITRGLPPKKQASSKEDE